MNIVLLEPEDVQSDISIQNVNYSICVNILISREPKSWYSQRRPLYHWNCFEHEVRIRPIREEAVPAKLI